MLDAIAVDLDNPPAAVVVQDVAHAVVGVDLDADVDLNLLPDNFDLVQVDQLVHFDRVF